MLADLGGVFRTVMKKYNLAPGDFPDLADFQSKLTDLDFTKFHSLRPKVCDMNRLTAFFFSFPI